MQDKKTKLQAPSVLWAPSPPLRDRSADHQGSSSRMHSYDGHDERNSRRATGEPSRESPTSYKGGAATSLDTRARSYQRHSRGTPTSPGIPPPVPAPFTGLPTSEPAPLGLLSPLELQTPLFARGSEHSLGHARSRGSLHRTTSNPRVDYDEFSLPMDGWGKFTPQSSVSPNSSFGRRSAADRPGSAASGFTRGDLMSSPLNPTYEGDHAAYSARSRSMDQTGSSAQPYAMYTSNAAQPVPPPRLDFTNIHHPRAASSDSPGNDLIRAGKNTSHHGHSDDGVAGSMKDRCRSSERGAPSDKAVLASVSPPIAVSAGISAHTLSRRPSSRMSSNHSSPYYGRPVSTPTSTYETSTRVGGGGGVRTPRFGEPGAAMKRTLSFQRGSVVGSGGFGTVFQAVLSDGTLAAVKALKLETSNHRAIDREVHTMSTLPPHPNCVRYFGSRHSARHYYIIMEYISGGSIQSLRRSVGRFRESVFQRYAYMVLLGLEHLHRFGIIHRDIKGANVLLDERGVAKIVDFGCCKDLNQGNTTLGGGGTPLWMAPEVCRGEGATEKSDVWSFGCLCLEMTNETGLPWNFPPGMNLQGLAYALACAQHPPPIPTTLSPLAQDFIACCLKLKAGERLGVPALLNHPFFDMDYVDVCDEDDLIVSREMSMDPSARQSAVKRMNGQGDHLNHNASKDSHRTRGSDDFRRAHHASSDDRVLVSLSSTTKSTAKSVPGTQTETVNGGFHLDALNDFDDDDVDDNALFGDIIAHARASAEEPPVPMSSAGAAGGGEANAHARVNSVNDVKASSSTTTRSSEASRGSDSEDSSNSCDSNSSSTTSISSRDSADKKPRAYNFEHLLEQRDSAKVTNSGDANSMSQSISFIEEHDAASPPLAKTWNGGDDPLKADSSSAPPGGKSVPPPRHILSVAHTSLSDLDSLHEWDAPASQVKDDRSRRSTVTPRNPLSLPTPKHGARLSSSTHSASGAPTPTVGHPPPVVREATPPVQRIPNPSSEPFPSPAPVAARPGTQTTATRYASAVPSVSILKSADALVTPKIPSERKGSEPRPRETSSNNTAKPKRLPAASATEEERSHNGNLVWETSGTASLSKDFSAAIQEVQELLEWDVSSPSPVSGEQRGKHQRLRSSSAANKESNSSLRTNSARPHSRRTHGWFRSKK